LSEGLSDGVVALQNLGSKAGLRNQALQSGIVALGSGQISRLEGRAELLEFGLGFLKAGLRGRVAALQIEEIGGGNSGYGHALISLREVIPNAGRSIFGRFAAKLE